MSNNPIIEKLRSDLAAEGMQFLLDPRIEKFRAPQLTEGFAYWRDKAGPDGIPFRRDFTPQTMRPFLTKVALFEVVTQPVGPPRWRARLTGQEFVRTFSDMSLKYIDDVVPAKFYARWKLIGDASIAYQRPFRMVSVPEAFDREHSVVESVIAPLLDENGEPNQIIGLFNLEFGASWEAILAEEARHLDASGV